MHRTDSNTGKVTLYLQGQDEAPNWAPKRRTEVENKQVEGMICVAIVVADLQDFDAWHIIRAFIPDQSIYKYMVRRLVLQQVLRLDDPLDLDPFPAYRLALPEFYDRETFLAALPLVHYDTSLALLVASPSVSSYEGLVKAQLAAMLSVGIHNVFKKLPNLSSNGKIMTSCCEGCTSDFADKGSFWFLLGLWKREKIGTLGWLDCSPYTLLPPRQSMSLVPSGYYDDANTMRDTQYVRGNEALRMGVLALHLTGVIPNIAVQATADEPETLSVNAQRSLFAAVFRSFVNNCVVAQKRDDREIYHMASSCVSVKPQPIFCNSFDLASIRKNDKRTPVTGVSYTLERLSGLSFVDWTWIPEHVVSLWKFENQHVGKTIEEALHVHWEIEENPDEIESA